MAFKFVKFHLSLWLQQNKLCICLNLLKYKSRALSFAEEALIEYVIYPIFKQIAIQVLENHIRGGGRSKPCLSCIFGDVSRILESLLI